MLILINFLLDNNKLTHTIYGDMIKLFVALNSGFGGCTLIGIFHTIASIFSIFTVTTGISKLCKYDVLIYYTMCMKVLLEIAEKCGEMGK